MSVTVTHNRLSYDTVQLLADYELHHSGAEPQDSAPAPNTHPLPPSSTGRTLNPPDWPRDARRIPPHRPINRELDQSQRYVFLNGIERAFVTIMFVGVWEQARLSWLWRNTGARLVGDQWFRFKIGGEW